MKLGLSRLPRRRQARDVSKTSIKSDLARIDRLTDAGIDYSDIPPLDKVFFTKATEVWPATKRQLTIRLDADVLKWLKARGRGYQTRINRILRAAMESQGPRARSRSGPAPKKNSRSREARLTFSRGSSPLGSQ
jgi:uncharacterized protein (DUF4415 family)